MSTSKIRVGIVGCGRVAEHHLRHLSARADVEVAGLVDANEELAAALGKRFGVANTYASLDALLAAQQIQMLHVLTPPSSHRELTLAAIDRGINVLVEKPFALNVADAKEMLDRAAARGVMIVPDFLQLYHPRMLEATRLIESGKLGRVVGVECAMGLDLDIADMREALGLHWSYRLPGGVLHNYITHPLYLVMRWSGAARRIHVAPRVQGSLPQGLADHWDILIDGEKANAYISMTMTARPDPYCVRIQCERGLVVVDFDTMTTLATTVGALPRAIARILRNPRSAVSMVAQTAANVWNALRKKLLPYHGLKLFFDEVYPALASGSPPPITPELTLAVAEAEAELLANAGKLHVNLDARSSKQANVKRKERVLVTGAAGYLGRHVVTRLVNDGYYVRVLVRPLSQIGELEKLGVEIMFGDLRDAPAVLRAAEKMDVIVHVGAAIRGTADYQRASTVGGTRNIASAAERCGTKRVIYISSMAVYDFAAAGTGTITAESALEARAAERGVASAVKREAEDIALEQARSGKGWSILRPSQIFGGNRDALGILGPKKGSLLICVGSPGARMRLVHADDVASAVVLMMEKAETSGRVYTLSHPDTLTYREYLKALPASLTRGVTPVFLRRWFVSLAAFGLRTLNRVRGRKGGMTRRQVGYLYADVLVDSKPMQELGWRPAASLRDQVAKS